MKAAIHPALTVVAISLGAPGALAQVKDDFVWRIGVQGGDSGPWGVATNWWRVDGNGNNQPTNLFPDAQGAVAWITNLKNKKNQNDKRYIISLANQDYIVGTLNLTQDDNEGVRIGSAANQTRSLVLHGGNDGQGNDLPAAVTVRSGKNHEFKTTLRLEVPTTVDIAAGARWTFLNDPDGLSGTLEDPQDKKKNLTKKGTGLLRLLAPSPTFDGDITVEAGGLTVGADRALGSTAGDTTVKDGAALAFMDLSPFGTTYASDETVFLNGAASDGQGAMRVIRTDAGHISNYTFNGTVSLESNSAIGTEKNCSLTLSRLVRDKDAARTLTKVGPGTLVLSGNNTFAGLLDIKQGSVVARHNSALGAAGQGARTVVHQGASLILEGANSSEAVELHGGGVLAGWANGSTSGAVSLVKVDTLLPEISAPANQSLLLGGVISDRDANAPAPGIRKTGKGTAVLSGASTYSGQTFIDEGSLRFNGGSLSAGGGSVEIGAKATLAGFGNLNGRTVNGGAGIPLVAPMPNGQNLQDPDQLAIGALNLSAGAYIAVIDGPLEGQFGQLGLGGPGHISGSRLRIDLGYAPEAGDAFTIIDNAYGSPLLGLFGGVSLSNPNWPGGVKGAWYGGDLYRFGVSYQQADFGTWNVVLTAIPSPGAVLILPALAVFQPRRR